ncbi:MAG TPA: cob(I)yrinic acid a,c-diamide adenosyltransferase [Bacteroidales bacterium]|nr:cob(I)yrinic acid a,c-diamide adenosyltransferase [Bacteroidales bacterium]
MKTHKNKIYTKTGDSGQTSLIGGVRVEKYDPRIEACGTLDELNSFIGLIRDFALEQEVKKTLLSIQSHIFIIESVMAAASAEVLAGISVLREQDVEMLEHEIDRMNEQLPIQQYFILPGGHPTVSYCYIACTVCRRAERAIARSGRKEPENMLSLKYINRLSDYLFVLARFIAKELGIEENFWNPGK